VKSVCIVQEERGDERLFVLIYSLLCVVVPLAIAATKAAKQAYNMHSGSMPVLGTNKLDPVLNHAKKVAALADRKYVRAHERSRELLAVSDQSI